MAGRLLVASPSNASPTNNDSELSAESYYFIVMEHPLQSVSYASRGALTPLASQLIDADQTKAGPSPCDTAAMEIHDEDDLAVNAPLEGGNNSSFMIISIDNFSGQLLHAGVPQMDLFPSMQEAIKAIPALCPRTCESFEVRAVCSFVAFAGGCITHNKLRLLFVEASTRLLGTAAPHGQSEHIFTYTIPPLLTVDEAKWYDIPLRMELLALHHLAGKSNDRVQSSRSIDAFCTEYIYAGDGDNVISTPLSHSSPYLFFAPGVDVTHGCIFENALQCCAASNFTSKRSKVSNICDWADGSTHEKHHISKAYLGAFLPSLPENPGRESLPRCDCLWNEELIAFCEVFGLGNCCCRLSLGSGRFTVLPSTSVRLPTALLVTRLSRLAFPGFFYGYSVDTVGSLQQYEEYTSTLEAEFQLFLLCENTCPNVNTRYQVSSITWRRGEDFVGWKSIFEQQLCGSKSSASGPSSPHTREDKVRAIFSAYIERYGVGTRIALLHVANTVVVQDALGDVGDGHASSHSSQNDCDDHSDTNSRNVSVDSSTFLKFLAAYINSNGPQPIAHVGELPFCRVPRSSAANEDFWVAFGIDDDAACAGDMTSDRGLSHYSYRWLPRICVGGQDELNVTASVIVSVGLSVCWLCEKLHGVSLGTEIPPSHQLIFDAAVQLFIQSATGANCQAMSSAATVFPSQLRECVINLLRDTPTASSSLVWETAKSIQRVNLSGIHSVKDEKLRSGNDHCNTESLTKYGNNGIYGALVIAHLAKFFIPTGGLSSREFLRCRSRLLTHPALLSYVVSGRCMQMQLQRATTLSRSGLDVGGNSLCESFCSSFTLNQSHRKGAYGPPSTTSRMGCYYLSDHPLPTPAGSIFQGLNHPSSQSLLLPPRIGAVEFIVALPNISLLTHIALRVVDATEQKPYAAPLRLTVSTSCYIGQPQEHVVMNDMPLPMCASSSTSCSSTDNEDGSHGNGNVCAERVGPHLIFYTLYNRDNDIIPLSCVQEASVALGGSKRSFSPNVPVVARFVRVSVRGSGCSPIAISPVLVFGIPLQHIPLAEQRAVVGQRTVLRRKLEAASAPILLQEAAVINDAGEREDSLHTYQPRSTNQDLMECGDAVSTDDASERRRLYVRKIQNSVPNDLDRLKLANLLDLESKRLQCRERRYFRDFCLQKIGVPLWMIRPSHHVFPHSMVFRSCPPEQGGNVCHADSFTAPQSSRSSSLDRLSCQLSAMSVEVHEKWKNSLQCASCSAAFPWHFRGRSCDRCKRLFCSKCISKEKINYSDFAQLPGKLRLCLQCQECAKRIESATDVFLWSKQENDELDSDLERDEAIDFYTRWASPHMWSFPLFQLSSFVPSVASAVPYQLTMHPSTRVVSVPPIEKATVPLFEEVLNVLQGDGVGCPLSEWRCTLNEGCLDELAVISRHVILLLPHSAVITHGVIHCTVSGSLGDSIEIEIHVGNSLEELCQFPIAKYGPVLVSENSVSGVCNGNPSVIEMRIESKSAERGGAVSSMQGTQQEGALLALLVLRGTVADLSLLGVKHFSLWGFFTPSVRRIHCAFYRVRPDSGLYAFPRLSACTRTCHALTATYLPRALSSTHLIDLKRIIPHARSDRMLLEFVLCKPSTVCGFVIERHSSLGVAYRRGIATALRLIGVFESYYRCNIGYFPLPWPPLVQSTNPDYSSLSHSQAYALPEVSKGVVSIIVEVVEWRLLSQATTNTANDYIPVLAVDDEGDGIGKKSKVTRQRRGIYLGIIKFWTSSDERTHRSVCSFPHSYNSVGSIDADALLRTS
ncbi:hypothetical protein TRVL_00222 [Trypanosoma vivax]|nr:hypothetical protein TRVL_00222 [Trypanosoma vivax]